MAHLVWASNSILALRERELTPARARDDCGAFFDDLMEEPLDTATLAAAAIAAAASYLAELGKEAAKSAAGAAGKSAWQWIKGKLTSGTGKAAVADLETSPSDTDNQNIAAAALAKFLKSDSSAVTELAQLLEKAGGPSTTLTVNVHRESNILAQNMGPGSVSINTGRPPKV
jgi:phage-related tail fiber protein